MNMLGSLKILAVKISFALFFISISLSCSEQDVAKFLQCLPTYSESSKPVLQSTYTQENSSFTSVLDQYAKNLRYMQPTTPKPVAIVVAMHESHIQASIICAKANNLQLRVRSGGHDFEALSYVSYVPFVIIDMHELRAVDVDIPSETAWVQAGATTGDIYYSIAQKSNVHAYPAGVCLTLGAGGHISGGGYGNLIRKYGLSVDNIIDAQIVDANGNILDREAMGEDVFWAIRGGCAASFGVLLSWKIKLVSVPEAVTVFTVLRTMEQGATDLVHKWQTIATALPEELFIRAQAQVAEGSQEGEMTVEIYFIGMFLGKPDDLLSIINKTFPELGLNENDPVPMSWINSTLSWAGYSVGTPIEVMLERPISASLFKGRSDYLDQPLEKSVIESIWQKMVEKNISWMQMNPYGGRVSEIPESATPFPHRGKNLILIHPYSSWSNEEDTEFILSKSKEFREFLTPYVSKLPREAFLNYRDLDVGSNPSDATYFRNAIIYGSRYFMGNFARLVRAKTSIDPDNFFKNEQSIPPLPSYEFEDSAQALVM